MTDATRELLWRYVEQPEPSTEGSWFAVPLEELIKSGFQYVEIHFPDDSDTPNAVRLLDEEGK
jgi:hypothetical protein